MRLLVFARDKDAQAEHVAACAEARGHEVGRVDFAALAGGAAAAWDDGTWLFRGVRVQDADAYVLRHVPAPTALLGPPDEVDTAGGWWRRGMLQKERSSFAHSCIMDVELSGKPVVNPLLATQPFDHKPLQLAVFRRAGLPVPRTLVTTSPEAVIGFEREMGEVVFKPCAGGAETGLLDDESRALLPRIASSPAIFQERVRGDDVRVTVVGGRVVSAVVIPSDALDYRGSDAYRRGEVEYVPQALPREAEELCLRAASLCRHVLSGIDLKRRDDGSYVLLEANSAPVYLDVERKTGAPITAAVLDWLEARARPAR